MSPTRVYVGGLSPRAGERDIERLFKQFGSIKEILLKNKYGFVEFEDERDAEDAVYDMHGKNFLGERLTVQMATGTPHGRDRERFSSCRDGSLPKEHRLVIENLSSRVTWQVRT